MKKLELDNVELSYGHKDILRAIYFKAEFGKITGILGSNGSGKTSLLRILFGELKPKSKLLRIDNHPILKPLYKYGKVKYLPQFHFLPKSLSLKKIFFLYNVDYAYFSDIFNDFKEKENFKFRELSGGEKRLIEVFLIIKSSSDILLLDEPFSYLAPIYNEQLKEEILKEKENKCIIITDHIYKKILEVSDDVYFLKEGVSKHLESYEDLVRYNYVSSL
ncbi:ATP-binding cassette domain-containing protein [Pseudotenacibaculum sp. MALMAid0570]|uniref:ATP-binding cassette domain-containing protein n=1 Tax=Pseudotenacibaculum sp. MALMAid0570 TaxID=3143938 RepID=UPI0032DF98EE